MGTNLINRYKDFWLGDRGLTAFLVLLFLALFLGPFIDSLLVRVLTSLFLSMLMVVGVATMSNRPEVRFFAGMVALAAIALRWMTHIAPTPAILRWSSLASLIFMVLMTMGVLYKVFMGDKPVTGHRVRGAIAAYLLFGITWSILYGLIDQMVPNAFTTSALGGGYGPERQESLIFFSFVTLTTVGYGDITPTHDISRMFAVMEALVGQLYPATLLARLVSLQIMSSKGQEPDSD